MTVGGHRPPARWGDLRRFTPARVALGRAGNGLPTAAHLDFQAAHAAARDAVHAELDVAALCPDLGRRLRVSDRASLPSTPGAFLFVICDGLSATAVQAHAMTLLRHAMPAL